MRLTGLLLAAALPAGVQAATPPTSLQLRVVPASPNAAQRLTVTFRGDGALAANARYHVSFFTDPAGRNCVGNVEKAVPGFVPAGRRVTVAAAIPPGSRRWCPGRWTAQLFSVDIDDTSSPGLAQRHFTVRKDRFFPKDLQQLGPTPVAITVYPNSTLTIKAPGRADRVLGLGGGFDGEIPAAPFFLNTDYRINLTAGGLHVRSLVVDPLCAATSYALAFPLEPGTMSTSLFQRSGSVSMSMLLSADPLNFAACGAAGPGPTTLSLSGMLGIKKLAELTLTGTLDGLQIADGVAASATVELHVKIDILDP